MRWIVLLAWFSLCWLPANLFAAVAELSTLAQLQHWEVRTTDSQTVYRVEKGGAKFTDQAVISSQAVKEQSTQPLKEIEIKSLPFTATDQYYSVHVGGKAAYNELYVSFRMADTGAELWRVTGPGTDSRTSSVIDLSAAQGAKITVHVVDNSSSHNEGISFAGLSPVDQIQAEDQMVDFHIDLMKWNHARADGERWLYKNLKARHLPKLHNAVLHRTNNPLRRSCLVQMHRFPSSTSVPVLAEIMSGPNEMFTRYAAAIVRDHHAHYSEQDRLRLEQVLVGLLHGHASTDARTIIAGTLYSLHTPTALAALKETRKSAPPALQYTIDFLQNSQQFTRTEFKMPNPGQAAECWIKGFQYYVVMPQTWNRGQKWRLLIGCHGTWGNGALYLQQLQAECDRLQVVGISPTFDPHRFWGFGHLGGKWRPDHALIEAIQETVKPMYLDNKPCLLFGHSEGAQFVSRFTLLHSQSVARVAISGTDELCFPDYNQPFPFGLGANPAFHIESSSLSPSAYLKVPTLLVVGTADHKANIQISENWANAINDYAQENRLSQRVTFIRNEGGLHSLNSNFKYVQQWLDAEFLNK